MSIIPTCNYKQTQMSSPDGQLGRQGPHDRPPPGRIVLVLPDDPTIPVSPEAPPPQCQCPQVSRPEDPKPLNSSP